MRLLLPCDHPGKPKRPKVGTRSSSVQGKRTPLKNRFSPLENLQETKSSDEEEVVEVEVDRPLKGQADEHVQVGLPAADDGRRFFLLFLHDGRRIRIQSWIRIRIHTSD
jgi:hypothetical protein